MLNKHGINDKQAAVISKVDKQLKQTASPKLHSLSTLQTKANRVWKYSPKDVLKIMQDLYDRKLLTYPRTDSNYITEHEFEYLKSNLNQYQKLAGINFDAAFMEPQKDMLIVARLVITMPLFQQRKALKQRQLIS